MSNTLELKDVLHYYLGCEVDYKVKLVMGDNELRKGIIIGVVNDIISIHPITRVGSIDTRATIPRRIGHFSIYLRPLPDMTEEEMQECGNMLYDFSDEPDLNKWKPSDFEVLLAPEQFHWLLSKHFDLFNLIDRGLAIDKTKIQP